LRRAASAPRRWRRWPRRRRSSASPRWSARFPEVNHNYQREHRYNLWFVVTAGRSGAWRQALGAIERRDRLRRHRAAAGAGISHRPRLSLDGKGKEGAAGAGAPAWPFAPTPPLDEFERRLVMALQEGLPLFARPFSVLASRVGCDESEVLERIRRWCAEGIIKRFGVVVRHHELGYTANAMLVHDIPDAEVAEIGELLAREPGVTLCYQRPRVPAGLALQPVLHDPRPGTRRGRGEDRRAARPPAPRAIARTPSSSR
jgi:DNA-binding Lrp family transcriptional regulator